MICNPEDLKTDFFLLRDGPIWVSSDDNLWESGTNWLRDSRGYKCYRWTLETEAHFFEEVSKTLCWEQQFGYPLWSGNLDALNDGATSWHLGNVEHVVISVDNAERLKKWFGKNTHHIWDIFQEAARMQLLFGAGLLMMVKTSSEGEATRWAKANGVAKLSRSSFPGGQLAKDAETI